MRIPPEGFLQGLRALADERELLLMFDEATSPSSAFNLPSFASTFAEQITADTGFTPGVIIDLGRSALGLDRGEIATMTLPVTGSTEGGVAPRWSPDGSELYYRWRDKLFAVAIDDVDDGFRAGVRTTLLEDLRTISSVIDYDVYDANRFLVVERAREESAPAGVNVVASASTASTFPSCRSAICRRARSSSEGDKSTT